MKQHPKIECICANPAEISVNSLPRHENDTMCRILGKTIKQAFKDPEIIADYERWKREYDARST